VPRRPAAREGAPKARGEKTRLLDASARRVLAANSGDAERFEALVHDLQQLRDKADRVAFQEPSPEALREYRHATASWSKRSGHSPR
jgi:hypothetical protein